MVSDCRQRPLPLWITLDANDAMQVVARPHSPNDTLPASRARTLAPVFPLQVNRKVGAEPIGKAGAKLSCLSMYSVPPTEKLSVTEFEEYAFDRLRCECPAHDTHRPALAR